jgi:hypothetical protein
MWKKIQGWSGKHLSKAGREVLVKSVAQAIPTYCMSSILLPESLGEELERMINSFWWGSNRASGKGINWLRWEKLTMRKEYGGVGFRHFYGFNLAMLGKQGWNLLVNHDTILSKVFKAKYYPKEGFLDGKLGHNPSYVWRSIQASQVVVKRGLRWRIGDGSEINVWHHPWLRHDDNPFLTTPMVPGYERMVVADLLQQNARKWNLDLVNQVFNPRDATEIVKIPITMSQNADTPLWRFGKNGNYSVRSAYYQLMEVITDNSHLREPGDWMALWKLKIPNRVKIFLWRTLRGCIPVKDRLTQRGVQCGAIYPCCEAASENEWHCFFGCVTVQEVWKDTGMWGLLEQYVLDASGYVALIFTLLEKLDSISCYGFVDSMVAAKPKMLEQQFSTYI